MLKTAGIIGVGAYVPPKIVTNDYFTQMYGISDRSIVKKTGIQERRYLEPNGKMTGMAVEAAQSALKDANMESSDIDLVLVATVTQEQVYPAMACQVQHLLGIPTNAGAFDMSIGCAGFVYALLTAFQYVQTGACQNVLVIGVDHCTRGLDFKDAGSRGTNILFGDGAGAVIVSQVAPGKGYLAHVVGSDGSGGKFMFEDANRKPHMNGEAIFNFAATEIPNAVRDVVSKANMSIEDIDYLVPHQANLRILEKAAKNLGMPIEKVATHAVQFYGNTSSASVPLALFEELQAGKIEDGQNIVLAGFGAGLSWAAVLLRWGM